MARSIVPVFTAIQIMKPQGGGSIVMISSLAAQTGGIHAGVDYAASKGGVIALAKAIVKRAAPFGIRVNCVNPGVIDTPMTHGFGSEVKNRITAQHPMGRWGKASEVANAVVFLSSEAASFINGAQLDVNGGIHFS